jgi:hypothetical protein
VANSVVADAARAGGCRVVGVIADVPNLGVCIITTVVTIKSRPRVVVGGACPIAVSRVNLKRWVLIGPKGALSTTGSRHRYIGSARFVVARFLASDVAPRATRP